MSTRAACLILPTSLIFLLAGSCDCGGDPASDDAATPRSDAAALDAVTTDAGATDAASLDAAGVDLHSVDVPSADLSRIDAAGSDLASADRDGQDSGPPPALDWDEPNLPHRVRVTLRPHPDRARQDLPMISLLEHPGALIVPDVQVYEVTAGAAPTAVAASAWSQPDGQVVEVGFTAAGTTAQGATREFLVYYQTSAAATPWTWSADTWASRQELVDGQLSISGGDYHLQREIDPGSGQLRSGRRSGGETFLDHLRSGTRFIEGFSTGYQLQTYDLIHDALTVEHSAPAQSHAQGDQDTAAIAAAWRHSDPVVHDLYLSYRVFRAWPFAQVVMSAPSSVGDLHFSSAAWSARTIYLTDTFDRLVSDTRGDEALAPIWDTSMRWLVSYDSSSDRAFGWFLFHRGVVRASDTDASMYDSYGYSADTSLVYRYLWMAAESKDAVVDLFDAMQPGVQLGLPESRDLNILRPVQGSYHLPEDLLEVVVSTPGNPAPVSARWTLPDASQIPVAMARSADPLVWVASAPLLVDGVHPEGTWTLTAESDGAQRQARIEVRRAAHPRLYFDSGELPELVARKDSTHAGIWADLLAEVSGYGDPISDPGPGRDIRSYGQRLITLALVQLIDPSQPYEDLLWTYYFTMLRYPNWDPDNTPFNNLDLTVGHFLHALATTYDWHYDSLSPAERAETRARLFEITDRWIDGSHMRYYPELTYDRLGTVTNNHYWINHTGVAAVTFALADQVDAARHQIWLDRLEANLGNILAALEDDGGTEEGVAYSSYGQINLYPWLDMRDRVFAENTATAIPWFESSAYYHLYSVLPGGDDNYGGVANFGDCPTRHYNPPRTIAAWLAWRLGLGHAQWMAESLQWPARTVFSYLWYDPSVSPLAPATLPTWRLFGDKGIFAWRSSWDDDAVYFSLKSGSYYGGHEQPDAGHFILHRAGVPYVVDLGYSYWKVSDEHNLIVVDGLSQRGGDRQWMAAVEPASWAEVPFALADARYFDLVADPTPMYQVAELDSWQREVVGLAPGIFVVRDRVEASAAVQLDWLLHSYRSDPPTRTTQTYSYLDRRLEDPFVDQGGDRWLLRPQDAAPDLHLAVLPDGNWSAAVEPSMFVPEQKLDVGGYNPDFSEYQLGTQLRRHATSDGITSLVALWFGDEVQAESWSDASAEALRLYDGAGEIAALIWPAAGSVSDLNGYAIDGEMGGRRLDQPAYFGRELTSLGQGAQTLVQASAPVSLFARLEHSPQSGEPRFALVQASAQADLELYCPAQPSTVRLDGAALSSAWAAGTLSLTVPAGEHRIDLE